MSRIADGLTAEGYSLWWDRKLHAGDDYSADIEAKIDEAGCVVVVWSAAARNSLWVRAEANAALEQDKLVQLAADKAKPPLPFTMLHLLDLSDWSGQREHPAWRELGHSIDETIAGRPVRERAAEARRAPPSMFGPAVAVGVGSIGLVALVGILAALMATGPEQSDLFGVLTVASFAAACLGLAYMLIRTVQIALASRRVT